MRRKSDIRCFEKRCQEILHNPNNPAKLGPREVEVLLLLLSGQKLSAVAITLNISEHTVSAYITRIYQKLGVHYILELAQACLHLGYITLEDFTSPYRKRVERKAETVLVLSTRLNGASHPISSRSRSALAS